MIANVHDFAEGLAKDVQGLWAPQAEANAKISYPPQGNEMWFAVEENSFWFRHRNAVIIETVKRHAPERGAFFDVGGGNGFVAEALGREGFETVVVEPGRAGALNARRRGLPIVICSTAQSAGFRPGSLPSVGMFDVLEHVADDEQMLRHVHQRLQPGRRLFLTVPSYRWLWSHEDAFVGHYRRYTRTSLKAVLERAGFEVEFQSYFFWFLPLPIFCLRSVPNALSLNRSITPETVDKDHGAGSSFARHAVERLLQPELRAFRKGMRIPFGSSLIAVARATHHINANQARLRLAA
jgi:SAM-dependent methyltransferase